jgi:hypothetical protein
VILHDQLPMRAGAPTEKEIRAVLEEDGIVGLGEDSDTSDEDGMLGR